MSLTNDSMMNKTNNSANKKRKNIALFMALLENEFSAAVLDGAVKGAKEFDTNLIVFPMGLIDGAYSDMVVNNFRYQYNVLSSFLKSNSIDGAIVEYGTIASLLSEEAKKVFLESVSSEVPTILLSEDAEGFASICANNKVGLKHVIEHVIIDHKCSKIGFVSGPKNNHDACERLDVYRETLKEHNIFEGEDWISYGDFSIFSENAVVELLEKHSDIEAIIFANDHMALGAYNVLKRYGRIPGENIIVTGFDNIPSSILADPPLTTVVADTKGLSYRAVKELVSDKKPEGKMYIDTHMIARGSCCSIDELYKRQSNDDVFAVEDDSLNDITKEKILEGEKRKNFVVELGNMLREMVFHQDSKLEWYSSVLDTMKKLDFGSSYIFLYDDYIYHRNHTPWNQPENVNLVGYYNLTEKNVYNSGEVRCNVNSIIEYDFFQKEHRYDLVVMPLFFRENQYGYMFVESEHMYFQFAFQVASQISSTLEIMRIMTDQERIREEFERDKKQRKDFIHKMNTSLAEPYNAIKELSDKMRDSSYDNMKSDFSLLSNDLDKIADMLEEVTDYFHQGLEKKNNTLASSTEEVEIENQRKEYDSFNNGEREFIVVIDNNPVTHRVIHNIFDQYCDSLGFSSGQHAYDYLNSVDKLPDIILLDSAIADIDAFELLEKCHELDRLKEVPVVITSYENSRNIELKSFEAGAADFFIKPFVSDIIKKRVRKILDLNHLQQHLEEEVKIQTEASIEERNKVERLSLQAMTAMAAAIDAKDKYTNGHSVRVAQYSKMIAIQAGKSEKETQDIYYIGLLHDVGKIGVPDGIINKTSRLTDEEFDTIKKHPEIGADILKNINEIPNIAIGAHWHHERYDGRGYPDGLKGEEIPEIARIIGVADAYDAMTSSRSYRAAMEQDKVRSEIEKGMGTQFDPVYAKIMLEIIDNDVDYILHG